MKNTRCTAVCLSLVVGAVYAATKGTKACLENCGVVLEEILNIPDNLPGQVLAKAECVIVFPSVLKLAFGMGKDYGRGAMVCRTGKEFQWTLKRAGHARARRRVAFELQIGGESTDLDSSGDEPERAPLPSLRQQDQAGRGRIRRRGSQRPRRFRGYRSLDARGDPQLFAFPRTVCRHFPRGFHAAPGQQSERADLRPQNYSKGNFARQQSFHSRDGPPSRSRIANEFTAWNESKQVASR